MPLDDVDKGWSYVSCRLVRLAMKTLCLTSTCVGSIVCVARSSQVGDLLGISGVERVNLRETYDHPKQKIWLKRRKAIEPRIGHAKAGSRMDRCWLQWAEGDAQQAVLCAADYNIRWLLRAIVRLGLTGLLLTLFGWAMYGGIRVRSPIKLLTRPMLQ